MNGVGKAVDLTNQTADKVSGYVKENHLDEKAKNAAVTAGKGLKNAGEKLGSAIQNAYTNMKNTK